MDDTTAPTIDLNIDPDMITPQGASPQMATPTPKPPVSSPAPQSIYDPGIIDITPGSKDVFPPITSTLNHIDSAPLPEPKTIDITPLSSGIQSNQPQATSVLLSPTEEKTMAVPMPPVFSQEAFVETLPTPTPPQSQINPTTPTPIETQALQTQPSAVTKPANSLAEDPDLVKLIK